jgi:hypothetical protein
MITVVLNAHAPGEGPGTDRPHGRPRASIGVIALTPEDVDVLRSGAVVSIAGAPLADFARQLGQVGDKVTLNIFIAADSAEVMQILQDGIPTDIHDPLGHMPAELRPPAGRLN